MEQTALRPKPLPGGKSGGTAPRERACGPRTGSGRVRRWPAALCGLLAGLVLLLAGVGLGAVGATVIGLSRLTEAQRLAGAAGVGGVSGVTGAAGQAAAAGRAPSPLGTARKLKDKQD
ncbi:PDZ domain-containing protein, partial [Streptomyces sp. NPDC056160]